MDIELLCKAIKIVLNRLNREGCLFNDHSWVKTFQNMLVDALQEIENEYSWNSEEKAPGRKEGDRVDILGRSPNKPNWIIEIDATRADQVAKKFVSRLALWGLNNDVKYVTILYPDTRNGIKQCEKYLRYGYDIIRRVNGQSNITGIFIEPVSGKMIVFDFKNRCRFDVNGQSCNSMNSAAAKALTIYLESHPVQYEMLKDYWGRYVSNSPGISRYKAINMFTCDSPPKKVYTYTQFRRNGIGSYWIDFVNKCKENNITITQKLKLYDGAAPSRPFKYIMPDSTP